MAGEKSGELRTGDVLGVTSNMAGSWGQQLSPLPRPLLDVQDSVWQSHNLRTSDPFQYAGVKRVSGKELVSKDESWDMQELG